MAALSPSDVPESAHGAGIGICVDVTGQMVFRPEPLNPVTRPVGHVTYSAPGCLECRQGGNRALLLAGAFLDSERARLNLAR